MSASFSVIAMDILNGSFHLVVNVIKVLIPLMIVIEILSAYDIMGKLAAKMTGLSKALGISPLSILPLLVTTVMGVTYGAGTLIEMNKANPIPKRDYILIAIFFFICHALIESTAIWGAVGANVFFISIGRLLFAFLFTVIAARLPFIKSLGEEPKS